MIETFTDALPGRIHHLAALVMREACDRGVMISLAESCTGGLLAAVLTDVEGCAHAFDRCFVAYTDDAKQEILAVPAGVIARHTAVSAEVAKAMAHGALAASQARVALSVTGYAGPGAPDEEPGLVFFGLARRWQPTLVAERRFGDVSRAEVRRQSLGVALTLLQAGLGGARTLP